jgi:hypothetical protein
MAVKELRGVYQGPGEVALLCIVVHDLQLFRGWIAREDREIEIVYVPVLGQAIDLLLDVA